MNLEVDMEMGAHLGQLDIVEDEEMEEELLPENSRPNRAHPLLIPDVRTSFHSYLYK
jgi:hypothetical protein